MLHDQYQHISPMKPRELIRKQLLSLVNVTSNSTVEGN